MIRLLAPSRYVGTLAVQDDVSVASIYVDGDKVAESPSTPIPLRVGSHAVRVTHPEFRDIVRFVDIDFKQRVPIRANLQQFPIVASQIRKHRDDSKPLVVGKAAVEPTPWYRQWYTVAGVGTAAFVTSAVLFAYLNQLDSDAKRSVDIPQP